jgi:hypothetical protein
MIDILLLLIIAGVTWCVASEGPWGAASTLIAVILSGLFAMNYFEPATTLFPASTEWQARADVICLLGLFAAAVTGLRMAGEYLMPTQIEVNPLAYDGMRWVCGALTGYVTMAFLLTALHTAPLPRDFMGFQPERKNLFDMAAPDRQWLGFTQYASEKIYWTGNIFDGTLAERYPGRPTEVLSSFPIRYAERRERYAAGGGAIASVSAPPPSAPAAGPPPSAAAPGGGGGPGF